LNESFLMMIYDLPLYSFVILFPLFLRTANIGCLF
jgi:hypothetical protein